MYVPVGSGKAGWRRRSPGEEDLKMVRWGGGEGKMVRWGGGEGVRRGRAGVEKDWMNR